MLNKKEGNITWYSNNNNNLPQAGNNTNRQAGTPFPPGEGSNPQGKTSCSYSGRRRSKFPYKQAQFPPPRPLLIFLPRKIVIPRQLLTFPPRKEATLSQQLLSFLLVKEAVSTRQSLIFLPRKIAIPRQLFTFLPRKEATLLLANALLPPSEGSSLTPATAHLPSQEGSNSLLAIATLPPGEGSNSTTALPPSREGDNPPPKQVNPIIKIGQSGKVSGILTGIGQPRLPGRTALSSGKTTPPLPHPLGPPRIFQ